VEATSKQKEEKREKPKPEENEADLFSKKKIWHL
jgi:hypothetical protein